MANAIVSAKKCTLCGAVKPIDEFYFNDKERKYRRSACKQCIRQKQKEKTSTLAGASYNRERARKWRERNIEYVRLNDLDRYYNGGRREKDSERFKAMRSDERWLENKNRKLKEHYANNKERYFSRNAEKRAIEKRATPGWASKHAISVIYKKREELSNLLGVDLEVDHIVPLRGKTVCGLHCEDNLQLLERSANREKFNSVWPDMPD